MVLMRLAMLWVGVAVASDPRAEESVRLFAEVRLAEADVFTEADAGAYLSSTLYRGSRVVVIQADRGGWTAIEPPPDTIDWVDASALEPLDGWAKVKADRAELRAGRRDARLPGPPLGTLGRAAEVELVGDVRPLVVERKGQKSRQWVAVRPSRGERRYVKSNAIVLIASKAPPINRDPAILTAQAPPVRQTEVPQDVADELSRIDASRRSMLREPLENWAFDPVLARYKRLLASTNDPSAQEMIRERIDKVERDSKLAESARRLATLLKISRKRDGERDQVRASIEQFKQDELEAYTLTGLIQPSAKQIEGRRLHLLIGEDGATTAYLDIPPGIDLSGLMTRRVGIRGQLRYDERLSARLITVRDVEPLGAK